jgi:hypothetical protein
MNTKEGTPVTQQRPGSAEPDIPDLDRIGEQVSSFWDDYAYVGAVAGAGVLVVALVVTAVVKVARSRQRDRWVAGLTALVVLAWTSEGLWEVARFTLGLPLGFAVMTFLVYEAMMLTCALQAERHRKHHPSPTSFSRPGRARGTPNGRCSGCAGWRGWPRPTTSPQYGRGWRAPRGSPSWSCPPPTQQLQVITSLSRCPTTRETATLHLRDRPLQARTAVFRRSSVRRPG